MSKKTKASPVQLEDKDEINIGAWTRLQQEYDGKKAKKTPGMMQHRINNHRLLWTGKGYPVTEEMEMLARRCLRGDGNFSKSEF